MGYVLFVKVYGQPKEVLRLLVSPHLDRGYNVALEILRVLQISAMEFSLFLQRSWAMPSLLPVGAFGLLPLLPLALAARSPAWVRFNLDCSRSYISHTLLQLLSGLPRQFLIGSLDPIQLLLAQLLKV
jgi:hypothetical protein